MKCYGKCPVNYFTSSFCENCQPNCFICTQANNCLLCNDGYYFLNDTCYEACPFLYFKSNLNCSSCIFANGTYIQNQSCKIYF